MTYYNTLGESGPVLQLFKVRTQSQDGIVLDIFRRYTDLTADEVLTLYPIKNTPLTSIRRSISDLHKEGKLIRTGKSRMGNFGRMVTVWKIIERC